MRIVSYPGDASWTSGLLALFSATGCGCHCRYWHFEGDKNDWQARLAFDVDENRRELDEAARAGSDEAAGLVAEEGGEVVGWLGLAPLDRTPKIAEARYYRSLLLPRRPGEWAVKCVLVRPDWRMRGVSLALAEAALDEVLRRGGRSVVAFPRVCAGRLPDEAHLRGTASIFERAGFLRVGGDDAFPLLRREA